MTEEKIDIFYAIKGGEDDRFMPNNCKSVAHCIFRMDEPHGDVYAGVCKYISTKHGGEHPYVFHIIEKECKDEEANLKKELNIPTDGVVLGRHGGADTFNLSFAYEPIAKALEHNPNLYFVFLNTNVFYQHERIKYLPWTMDEREKARFVNTCDAMIHARFDGEIFSLSTAEFSVRNKPIITWDGHAPHYDRGHIEILKDKALYYTDASSLFDLLKNIDKEQLQHKDWDAYKDIYSPSNVMKQFDSIFYKMIDRKTIQEHVKKHHPQQGEDSFDDGHLGGCNIKNDYGTYYPIMWEHMVKELGIKSVLDVGCGFGYSLVILSMS